MVILKNIFNFIFNNLNFSIIFISTIIKFLLLLLIKKNFFFLNLLSIYFNNFIKNVINKESKNLILIFSIILFNIILLQNLLDLLPNSLIKNFFLFLKNQDLVPTANINITFSLSIISLIIIIYLTIKKTGIKKFIISFFNKPINIVYLYFFNFIIESISYLMKPISLSLRLFGNIFSSDIIFKLINNINLIGNVILNNIWGIFHYLILPLQSFIFITLVIIYISQSINH